MELWNHQIEAIEKARQQDCLAIFHKPGLGKTLTTSKIIEEKLINCELGGLIVCPKSVVQSWKTTLKEHTNLGSRVVTLTGRVLDRAKQIREAPINSIFITNFEGIQKQVVLDALMKRVGRRGAMQSRVIALVIDESQRCKNPSTKNAKHLQKIADLATYRYILTGTPIIQDEMDVFSQYKILDRGKTFGRQKTAFQLIYFTDQNSNMRGAQNYWPNWVVKPGMRDVIAEKMNRLSVVADKGLIDLPDRIVHTVKCGVSPEQRRLYNEMAKNWVTKIETEEEEEKVAMVQMAMHKSLRMMQILTGHLPDDDGNIHTISKNPRLDILKDLLSDYAIGEKVVIWTHFRATYADIEKVCKSLKLDYATMYGSQSNRDEEKERFINDPNCKVMIANPKAAGTGTDGLQVAAISLYYSKSHGLEDYIQSRDRTYRGGSDQHERCLEIHIEAENTIDQEITKALKSKKKIGDQILSWEISTI